MTHVARDDRRFIAPEKFREAMRSVFGERPNFRRAAKASQVARSTLHRLWQGATSVSCDTFHQLAETFGVHPDWLTYPLQNPPTLAGRGNTLLAVGHVFPGTPRGEVRNTGPTVRGLYWLARALGAIERTLGHADSDLWMLRSPLAPELGRMEPGPMAKVIDDAFKLVNSEWGVQLGGLPVQQRRKVLDAWYQAWGVTLEAAETLRPAGGASAASRVGKRAQRTR